jgi:hypothetical protein
MLHLKGSAVFAEPFASCGDSWLKLCSDGTLAEQKTFSPKCADDEAHINMLEFMAIIVNMWMLLKLINAGHKPEGYTDYTHIIAKFLADNTSALLWLNHAGCTK